MVLGSEMFKSECDVVILLCKWTGKIEGQGREGLFPASYVKLLYQRRSSSINTVVYLRTGPCNVSKYICDIAAAMKAQ